MKRFSLKILLSPWTALITLALLLGIRVHDSDFVAAVRLKYFDQLITSRETTISPNIITVNIDEAALDKYGQYPFPRETYARIIDDLYGRGAGVVVLGVLFAEPDRFGTDDRLAAALKKYPVVLPSVPSDKTKNHPRNPGSAVMGPEHMDRIVSYPGIIANIEKIETNAAGIGIVNTLPEPSDGVTRRMPLVVTVDNKIYPALSMEVLRVVAGDNTVQIKLSEAGVEKMRIPKFGPVTTDSLGRIWVDWAQTSMNYSLSELPKTFDGAIVIVGPTAAGISNPVPTSRGAVHPHQVQAATLATLINGTVIVRPAWSDLFEIAALAVASILLLLLSRWVYAGLATTIVLASAGVIASYYAYTHYLFLFDATAFTVGIILVALHAYGVKFVSEFLQKMQIKKQFGTYLSPALVEKLQKNPEILRLGGESRELSIMFTDVRGFTSISEHYGKDVQGLTQIMNRYMTAMTAKILENGGTLDKYIGDAQMAFWNAPLDDAQHAKNAVRTGLQMLGSLDVFNAEISPEGVPPFGMGLGINTDTVVVGNMGSTQRFDYTCLGDGVNLASRLEGQSKPYGVKIVLGAKTAQQVRDEFFVLELDKIAVKGKKEGVYIYTVLPTETVKPEYNEQRELHDFMLQCYREKKWASATKFTQDLIGSFDGQMDSYYEMWLERIEEMSEKTLPEDWSGTYIATSK